MLTMTAGAVDSAEAETLLVKYVETHYFTRLSV
jgi:hypothetical protein